MGSAIEKLRSKKISKKWIIIGAVVLLLIVFIVVRAVAGGSKSSDSGYTFFEAEYRDISVVVNATSTVEPLDSYSVIALVRGDVLEAPFEEGDTIEEGDLLYKIDTSDAESTVRQMEENVETARIGVEQAEIALAGAKRSYQDALKASGDLTITSNVAGQITKLNYKAGEMVTAGTVVAEVSDRSNMLLELPFNSSDAANISAGQAATVTLVSTGEVLTGKVTKVSSVETIGLGGALVRNVTISVSNPGGISETMSATAAVGVYACNNSGTFSSKESASIVAKVSGDVEKIYAEEGAWVSAGSAILKIEGTTLDSQVKAAADGVKNAELALENTKNSYESMKKNLEDAQEMLEDYSITSPISGTVIEKNFKVGDTIDATTSATVMAVVYDMSALEVELQVDELDISKIKVGQEVEITVDALDGAVFNGSVSRVGINGIVAAGVTSFPVTVMITDIGELKPGMNVTADIQIENLEEVLTIPLSAVSRGNTVIIKDEESKGDEEDGIPKGYRRVEVELGSNDDNYVEVKSGLSAGDVVAVDTSTSSIFEMMQQTQQNAINNMA